MKDKIKIEKDNVYQMDCLQGMKMMKDSTVNLVVTSPPYNVGMDYNEYVDDKPHDEYIGWMTHVFRECYRVLKEDGRMCVNIGDLKNGSIPLHADFINIGRQVGFDVLTILIWNKNNTSNRTAWGSFMSPSSPSFPRCFEYIIVFRKSSKLTHKGEPTMTKEEFIEWSNGMWQFKCENHKKIGHPAAFPVELPKRCIKMFSYKDDVILDPFMGSGTTAVACIQNERHYIGFEIDSEYYQKMEERIKNAN